MKCKYIIILVLVGILAISGIILSGINSHNNIRIDKIIGVWNKNNITYIETLDGNIWTINNKDNNIEKTKLVLVFDTLGTDTIYDDVIIDIR